MYDTLKDALNAFNEVEVAGFDWDVIDLFDDQGRHIISNV